MDGQRVLMANALMPPRTGTDLATMTLDECPDLGTAIAAGLAHGLPAPKALNSAWAKWMRENSEAIQEFGIANFYDGLDADCAMVNSKQLSKYLLVMVTEQIRQIAALTARLDAVEQGILNE